MAVSSSRIFRSGNSEAVRLPREVAFGHDIEVTIMRSGDVLTLFPTKPPLSQLVETLADLPHPTEIEVRDEAILPEPEGL